MSASEEADTDEERQPTVNLLMTSKPALRGRAPGRTIDTNTNATSSSLPSSPSSPMSPVSPRFYTKQPDGQMAEFTLDQQTGKHVSVSKGSPNTVEKAAALKDGVKGISKLMERKIAAQEGERVRRESRTETPSDRASSFGSSASVDLDA
mmetsp:Transcript_67936/g.136701  ORF Transcript_67936/g.136701 Transcript_67936/m.136701 type:complete len:150 (-) Transcript_67936:371-820(-)